MAQLIKNGHTVTTTYAPEIVSLRAQGYTDAPAPKPAEKPAEPDAVKPAPKTSK